MAGIPLVKTLETDMLIAIGMAEELGKHLKKVLPAGEAVCRDVVEILSRHLPVLDDSGQVVCCTKGMEAQPCARCGKPVVGRGVVKLYCDDKKCVRERAKIRKRHSRKTRGTN